MRKKLAATLTIAIFLISTLAIVNPVSAHFTLGNLTNTYRYHANDFDPHVCGIIGYVWPGGGLAAYTGAPNSFSNILSPGYQSPYPGSNPPGAPINDLQLQGDEYAPFGAILAGSTGDLIFAINATATFSGANGGPCSPESSNPQIQRFSNWFILIPPEFTLPDSSQLATTLGNDPGNYQRVYGGVLNPLDRFGAGWKLVRVRADSYLSGNVGSSLYFNSATGDQWYYLRLNGVRAPTVAGRYFFKMFLRGSSGTTGLGGTSGKGYYWVPVQNWPVVLVKGEVDPAIITGTVRYGGFNSTLYGHGILQAGRVWAHMTTKLDPYTGNKVKDCPAVTTPQAAVPPCTDAMGYFNSTAGGHFEVEGVAPGTYTLFAEAAGYPQTQIATGVTILKGQSLHFDGYLQPGPVIHGNVYTKHQFGEQPWPENSYIRIDLYSAPTLSHVPATSAGAPVLWSPIPCVAGGQDLYSPGVDAQTCGDPRLGGNVAFPYQDYNSKTGYVNTAQTLQTDGSFVAAKCESPHWCGTVLSTQYASGSASATGISTAAPNNLNYVDPAGVGPPQHWFVQGGTTNPFHFEFGSKGEYGAPRDFDAHVPQLFATWVNGLTAGRYYARAWVFRYVQSALDGSTFQEYSFDVTPQEWAGDVSLPIDLRLSSWVNKTVYFHNLPGTIEPDGINTGAAFLVGALKDTNGVTFAYNVTTLPVLCTAQNFANGGCPVSGGYFDAWDGATYHANPLDPTATNINCNTPGANQFGRCNIQLWGLNDTWTGANYGIPSGTYSVKVYALGYIQQQAESVAVTLSGNPTQISDHLYRGVGFNFTVYSIDWERPRVNRNWVWGANQDAGCPSGCIFGSFNTAPSTHPRASDIEIGILLNGTLVGEECSGCDGPFFEGPYGGYRHPATESEGYNLTQNPNTYWVQADGGGVNVLPTDNAAGAYFGGETLYPVIGGDQLSTGTQCDVAGRSILCGTRTQSGGAGTQVSDISPFAYGFTRGSNTNAWRSGSTFYAPTAFDSGLYCFHGWTYGYIQDKDFCAYALKGQVLDQKLNLIVGVNVTLSILFKKESIITGTPANMSARIRLFNDKGVMVAGWLSSEGVYITGQQSTNAGNPGATAVGADNTHNFQLGPNGINNPNTNNPSPYKGYNYVPGGVSLLQVKLASLPGFQGDYGDPVFCGWANGCVDWEIDTADLGTYPNDGILGFPDYTGGWTAEVDFVNWYHNNTFTFTCDNLATSCAAPSHNYYPPVPGLLMGESYHIIPGTTATSGISFTEDGALNSDIGVGHSMAPNHLGPYSQPGVWQIQNAHNSGEASGVFEVDLNGLVSGNALAFTWSNEFRPLSWGLVTVTGAKGGTWNFYTYDSYYEAYLPPGTYKFTITSPGYTSQSWSVAVSPGMSGSAYNIYLEQSNIPVPEFSGIAIVAMSALAASLYLLRRRRR